jgi:serine/threonine protein kinase
VTLSFEDGISLGEEITIDEFYKYKIIDIKEGGMSIIIIATRLTDAPFHDLLHQKKIAIKTFKKTSEGHLDPKLFEHELKIWINLENVSIAPLKKIIVMKNNLLAIMPFYRGSLREIINNEGSLNETQTIKIILHILNGLHHAYKRHGVVHRDVKPENILSNSDAYNDKNKYFVTDWGISNIQKYYFPISPSPNNEQTQVFKILSEIGTLPYMSPERLLGNPSDITMDIYSLGIMFFELLFGYLPFNPYLGKEMPYQILEGDYYLNANALLNRSCDKKLTKLILKCIYPDKARRYKNYDKLVYDLYKLI